MVITKTAMQAVKSNLEAINSMYSYVSYQDGYTVVDNVKQVVKYITGCDVEQVDFSECGGTYKIIGTNVNIEVYQEVDCPFTGEMLPIEVSFKCN